MKEHLKKCQLDIFANAMPKIIIHRERGRLIRSFVSEAIQTTQVYFPKFLALFVILIDTLKLLIRVYKLELLA